MSDSTYRILLVEDDRGISEAVESCLQKWNMEAFTVTNFSNIMQEFASFNPHLVLLDITLPFMDGYHWCREIRKVSSVPIVFISSAADNMNIIRAMELGADDFIPKPFDQSVLTAKVQAILRRTYDFANTTPVIECNGVILDTGDNSFTFEGHRVELSKNEYRILYTLMQNKKKVVSRESLMEALWQTDSFVDENTLTVNVNRLRKKLEAVGVENFIATKFGVGYIVGEGK